MFPRLLRSCSLGLCVALCSGCTSEVVDDGGEPEQGSDTDGIDDICELEEPYICECLVLGEWSYEGMVYGEYGGAVSACANLCFAVSEDYDDAKLTPVACAESAPSLDCSDWNPPRAVSYHAEVDTYQVDHDFIRDLIADPDPLRSCDDATVSRVTSGGFIVAKADGGELLHELGLRDGDVITSINGYPLTSTMDAALAFSSLWSGDETNFELELQRDGVPSRLRYTYTGR